MNTFKKLRQEKGLTQVELAKILNIDQTTVSKWELGKAIPDTGLLIRLSSFFDVSTDYLLGLSTLFYPDKVNLTSTNSEEEELVRIFQNLSPLHRSQIIEYARYFSERENNLKQKKNNK